jgi:hypothetical protein
MFGKCLKHEFRATKRQLVPLFIAMLAVSILAGIFFGIGNRLPGNEDSLALTAISEILSSILMLVLFGLMFAVVIVAFVMIIRRFYTSFFTDEGYLTFTLPVTINQHIFSKFITAYIWQVISAIVSFICVIIMAILAVLIGGSVTTEDDVTESINSFEYILDMLGIEAAPGFLPTVIILGIIYLILSLAVSIFMVYLSISFGCMLAKKHRVICGIVSYYVINLIFSTITSVIQSVIAVTSVDAFNSIITVLVIYNVIAVIQILVCYIGTKWVLTKRLNLD